MDFINYITPPAPPVNYFTNMGEFFVDLRPILKCDLIDEFDSLYIRQDEYDINNVGERDENLARYEAWTIEGYGGWPVIDNRYTFKIPMNYPFNVFTFYVNYIEEDPLSTNSFEISSKETIIEIDNRFPKIQDFILNPYMDTFLNEKFFNLITSKIVIYFKNTEALINDYTEDDVFCYFTSKGAGGYLIENYDVLTNKFDYNVLPQSIIKIYNYIIFHPMFSTIFNMQMPEGPDGIFNDVLKFELIYNYKKIDLFFKGDLTYLYEKFVAGT
jgi:hypothetical protein